MKRDRLALPILLLLLTVLVPSAGVMWMMREAVRNERAATNQRLLEAYRLQLDQAAKTLKDRWEVQQAKISDLVTADWPVVSFSKIASNALVDSVVLCDNWGEVVYPVRESESERIASIESERIGSIKTINGLRRLEARLEASRMEFVEGRYLEAAAAYGDVIENYSLPTDTLEAVLGKARCLDKAGDRQGAITVLQRVSRYWTQGARAESHKCAACLRLLELSKKGSPVWKDAAKRLEVYLRDFEKYPTRVYQRRFLINEFQRLTGQSGNFAAHDAESLAIEYVSQLKGGTVKLPGGLRRTKIPGVWQDYNKESKFALLYRTATIRKELLSLCDEIPSSKGIVFSVSDPGEASDNLMDVSLGPKIGEWQLGLRVTDGNPFSDSSKQQNAVYIWIAALTVATTCVLAWLLLAVLRRRMRLAQLKNDLVATVSHELKTPLASIRLLVDTLLQNDGRAADVKDQQQTTEYLQLISAENARLTRLVENFLTFSRMERGQHPFDFSTVDAGQLAEKAASVFLDHCPEASECLSVDIRETAQVSCDQDSMVTAIVNLLENAWKYGGDDKDIQLQVDSSGDHAQVRVSDKGQGLTPREVSRVFDRFYQVDQRVARTQGGCGLGLSIVRSIVEAHGGSVAVDSKLDVGSTFVIQLPRSE